MSGLKLLEAFYYELGLGGEGISHRAPIPAFIPPLIGLQAITGVCIEDVDDFCVTTPMKKTTIGHMSKMASALPDICLIISQTLSRGDIDSSIHHRDLVGPQERDEYFLRSFSGLQQYLEHFQDVTATLGLRNVSKLALTELFGATEGNLASTMLHLCHPLLNRKWK